MDNSSRSVARVIAILDQLSVAPRPLSNLELATALDVPLSSMHRLLQKLTALGYIDCDAETTSYAASPLLSQLGVRLAELGGYSQPLRDLMGEIHEETGYTVTVWVPRGAHVGISALLVGVERGPSSRLPGELADLFSTPGLAISAQYDDEEIRRLATMARRHRVPLGRNFTHIAQVRKAVEQVTQRGYATGFNMRGDGWGMAAWPIPITISPARPGCLAVGAPVPELRRELENLVDFVNQLRQRYLQTVTAVKGRPASRGRKRSTTSAQFSA